VSDDQSTTPDESGQPDTPAGPPVREDPDGGWEDFIERSEPTENTSFRDTAQPDPHPWRRWLARSTDYMIGGIILGTFWAFYPFAAYGVSNIVLGFMFQILWILPLAILLAATGTTPGKWLFGISVRDAFGRRPSFQRSLNRETRVLVQGLAIGIPFISLITMFLAKNRLEEWGVTAWDERLGLEVRHDGFTWVRGITALATWVVIGGLIAIGANPSLMTPFLDGELSPISDQLASEVEKAGGVILGRERVAGQLDEGGRESFPLLLDRESVTVLATCDIDCADMDLTLVGPMMDTVALDHESDAYPFFHYTVSVPGQHDLVVDMYSCTPGPCAFVAQILRYDVGDTGTEGTCFAVSPDGVVATANHVVQGATSIIVGFADGTVVPARILTTADSSDVALLATDIERSWWLGFADPASIGIGDPVFTLGYPATSILGHGAKFTEGSISSLTGLEGDPTLLQTSAPIQPGNSGGPLLDQRGDVVGMIVSTAEAAAFFGATGSLPQNVNWAVRGDLVSRTIPRRPPDPPSIGGADVVDRALASVCWVDIE
jgi:uncharacterized RDD family membrane protein YckC